MNLLELLENAPQQDNVILESLVMTEAKLREYDSIVCSVSGGSDSDIVIDLCQKFDTSDKITYVFFDTGLEYKATKEHLLDLEKKYNIKIQTIKAIKTIPVCCKEYGQPFLSKQVSEWISRLQRHDFKWEDEPFETLYKKYPKCKAALRWWCNDFGEKDEKSRFNISHNQYLKEFMVLNPPKFKISNKCCHYAKKMTASQVKLSGDYDLNIYGVRKYEGGARGSAYKTCFSSKNESVDEYRPIFWYLNNNKQTYETFYNVTHSKCYVEYGLKRTGCAGCPYGRNFEEELEIIKNYEPKLYLAVTSIFKEAYDYTRKYKEFVKKEKYHK